MYNHISFYGPFASRFQKPLSKDARIVPIKIHMLPRFQTPTWTHPLGRSTVLGLRPVDLTSTSNTTVICPKIRVPIEGTWRNKSTTCTQTKTDAEIFQHIPSIFPAYSHLSGNCPTENEDFPSTAVPSLSLQKPRFSASDSHERGSLSVFRHWLNLKRRASPRCNDQ